MSLSYLDRLITLVGGMNETRQCSKVRYPLTEIVLLVVCDCICGAETIVDIVDYGIVNIDFLITILPF